MLLFESLSGAITLFNDKMIAFFSFIYFIRHRHLYNCWNCWFSYPFNFRSSEKALIRIDDDKIEIGMEDNRHNSTKNEREKNLIKMF